MGPLVPLPSSHTAHSPPSLPFFIRTRPTSHTGHLLTLLPPLPPLLFLSFAARPSTSHGPIRVLLRVGNEVIAAAPGFRSLAAAICVYIVSCGRSPHVLKGSLGLISCGSSLISCGCSGLPLARGPAGGRKAAARARRLGACEPAAVVVSSFGSKTAARPCPQACAASPIVFGYHRPPASAFVYG